MSYLQRYASQYKGKIAFYTVNSHDNQASIRSYQAAHKLTLPVLWDGDHQVAVKYGIDSLPTLFVVDADGRIRYFENGFDPQMDSVFPKLLDALVARS
jgi:cytochrome c biogenesis protein CcmG, thiol:disulfide interchange protein DsbE